MKEILKKGDISQIILEGGGALTGEVHLLGYKEKKYILRKCLTLKRAKFYEEIESKLGKYGFLPKILKRQGRKILYEYVKGRHLKRNEKMEIFGELGKIVGRINTVKSQKMRTRFDENLKNLLTGRFKPDIKIRMRRKRSNIKKMPKKIINGEQYSLLKKIHKNLMEKTKAQVTWDPSDITVTNFILKKNKVYLVDIDSIKPALKGYGIAKFFDNWAKTPQRQKAFKKGYESILSMKYLDKIYEELINLEFLIQRLNWHNHVGRDMSKDLKKLKNYFK